LIPSYTEQFDNAAWTKGDATISANDVASPDGRTTADKLVENSSNAQHYVQRAITVSAATRYTWSMYAKADERTRFSIFDNGFAGAASAVFDLSAGTVVSTGANADAASIEAAANGFYRLTLTWTTSGAQSAATVRCRLVDTGTNVTYTGDGASGLHIWGAQLGYAAVGATRAASVVWRGGAAAEIDYAAQAAAVESRIIIGVGSDGEILIDDVSVEA
jgi:hypothetical protein